MRLSARGSGPCPSRAGGGSCLSIWRRSKRISMQAKKDLEEEGELRLPKEGGRWAFED